MSLRKYSVDTRTLNLPSVKRELIQLQRQYGDPESYTWGYFPELDPAPEDYLATTDFLAKFGKSVLQSVEFNNVDIRVAFVRIATAEPLSSYGGMHIDVSRGVGHQSTTEREGRRIRRWLFVLGDQPRTLEYCPINKDELRNKGVFIPENSYKIVDVPTTIPTTTIEIPPIESDGLYGLSFLSSDYVHAGRTTKSGHFLLALGAYVRE